MFTADHRCASSPRELARALDHLPLQLLVPLVDLAGGHVFALAQPVVGVAAVHVRHPPAIALLFEDGGEPHQSFD
jgi:hypothetical protein